MIAGTLVLGFETSASILQLLMLLVETFRENSNTFACSFFGRVPSPSRRPLSSASRSDLWTQVLDTMFMFLNELAIFVLLMVSRPTL
jgi:hypothetical protein